MENENKIEVMNVAEEAITNDETNEVLGKKINTGKVVGLVAGIVVAAGVTVLIYKNRNKIKEMRLKRYIKKLEKNGYDVIGSLDTFDNDGVDEVNP